VRALRKRPSEVPRRELLGAQLGAVVLEPLPKRVPVALEHGRVLKQGSHAPVPLAPREPLERVRERLAVASAAASQDVEGRAERHPSRAVAEVTVDRADVREAGELGHTESALSQRLELRRRPRQRVNTSKLAGPEALHIDAVPEEGVPGEVVVRIGDEDARTCEDALRVLAPDAIELRAAGEDLGRNASAHDAH